MKDWRKALAFWLFVILASGGAVYFLVLSFLQDGPAQTTQVAAVAPQQAPAQPPALQEKAEKKKPVARHEQVLDTTPVKGPDAAVSAIRITLRNGKSIIAEICRDRDGKLVCEKADGLFEVERQDVVEIREVKVAPEVREQFVLTQASQPEKAGEAKKPDEKKAAGQAGVTSDQAKRLDELEKRRTELTTEGDQIAKDREKLRADIQALGITKSRTIADEYQQRINALDERIKIHNERVNTLNNEINAVSGDVKK